MEIQTEVFLEEISDRVPELEAETQTDPFLDRPPSPHYVPPKTGIDKETQIYEGDLFHFDLEVEPILEVLVGKTLEQGMMEVLEEEELANMRAHQQRFEQKRNAELAETQRLEAAERRRVDEKERRMAQERARVQKEQQAREKLAARSFAQGYLHDLQASVFGHLHEAGCVFCFFFHRVSDLGHADSSTTTSSARWRPQCCPGCWTAPPSVSAAPPMPAAWSTVRCLTALWLCVCVGC
jgi:hypothetical protein